MTYHQEFIIHNILYILTHSIPLHWRSTEPTGYGLRAKPALQLFLSLEYRYTYYSYHDHPDTFTVLKWTKPSRIICINFISLPDKFITYLAGVYHSCKRLGAQEAYFWLYSSPNVIHLMAVVHQNIGCVGYYLNYVIYLTC